MISIISLIQIQKESSQILHGISYGINPVDSDFDFKFDSTVENCCKQSPYPSHGDAMTRLPYRYPKGELQGVEGCGGT
jgi:hypothetical protein